MTTTTTPPLTQLIGQAEKTMNVLLDRLLAGEISERQWVTLVLLAGCETPPVREQFTGQVAAALRTDRETAADHIARLTAKGFVADTPGLALTESGREFLGRMRRGTGAITGRLWGDLPAADLATTSRVLSTILERAETELTVGQPDAG